MGGPRRKKITKRVIRRREPLPIAFECPLCKAPASCRVVLNRITGVGSIKCGNIDCDELFQTSINKLSEPIDVFFAWTDALEAVATDVDYWMKKKEEADDEEDDDGYSDEILKAESGSEKEDDGEDIKEEEEDGEDIKEEEEDGEDIKEEEEDGEDIKEEEDGEDSSEDE